MDNNDNITGQAPGASNPIKFFEERAARADTARALEMLANAGTETPRSGDQIEETR